MTASLDSETRILIGASSFADATAALKILRRLQLDTKARLGGLFVEESETIALCQMPNQRIVSSSGVLVVAPSLSQVRTLIEADAKAFRKSLAQMAEPIGVHWTFEQSMGDLVQKSLQASAGWDIVVFGHRNIHPVGGKIVLLTEHGAHETSLAGFADQLAEKVSAESVVISVGQGQGAARHHFDTIQAALSALARINLQAVLVDLSHGPVRTSDELRQLLDVARCPVFAFGAALSGAELEHSTLIPPAPGAKRDPNGT